MKSNLKTKSNIAKKVKMSGAEAVISCLLQEGVDTTFGYTGGAIMPVFDALYDYQDKISHYMMRHEQGVVHAAQGFAEASGKVGVCLVTSGPGSTNLITGIADAFVDSTPLVCITGQVGSNLLGSDAFQETDIIGISTSITKWNIQVTDVKDLSKVIAKAFYIAKSGRPGPVLIDITKDVFFDEIEFQYKQTHGIRSYNPEPNIDSKQVEKAAKLINSAKKPLVLLGHGVILGDAENEFGSFIEKAGLPTAWTSLGISALSPESPYAAGMLGMHGNYGPNLLTNQCDVLIAVGMRFDDRITGNLSKYAKQAKIIHLDIDPSEINKNVKVDVPVLGNCKLSLPLLTAQLNQNKHPEWLQKFNECKEIEFKEVIEDELFPHESKEISMGEVIRHISKETEGNALMVTDVGQHQMITQRYYKYSKWNSNITSGGLGTMGFGLPAAIGAKIGTPNREVILVVGDGGFQMTIQELGSILQHQVDVKILLLNNEYLGMVKQWQDLFFEKRYAETKMLNPDFQTIAKGYHINAEKVTDRNELASAVKRFVSAKESYLLEVKVGKHNNVFPMIPTGAAVSEMRLK